MFIKRAFDLLISGAMLVLLSPFLLAIAMVIRLKMGSPVLFRQLRPGWKGRPFTICKFRTMLDLQDANGKALPDSDRLVGVGRFLRATSLDELPELWNVFIGEMSLVGPRPLLMEYLDLYTPEQARRHDVKPGVTGWAQIHGRNTLNWEDRFQFDLWYVNHWSFVLDMKILLFTMIKVLKHEGISAEGHATMPNFTGSENRPAQNHPTK